MENPHIDIERMIMQSQYKQTLNSVSANTASNMSDKIGRASCRERV